MLNLAGFKKEFISQCRITLREFNSEDMRIEERKVNKAQRGMLNGMLFIKEGSNCAPTIYVEDFYSEYKAGQDIRKLSRKAVETVVSSMQMADILAQKTEELLNDPENLRLRLLNKRRNAEYLKSRPSKDVGSGLVFIADIRKGEYGIAVTYDLMKEMGLTESELFDKALENTVRNCPALLYDLRESIFRPHTDCRNLLEEQADDMPDEFSHGYVLTNSCLYWGAGALFYPDVIEKIHGLLDDSFYVIPSSVHEVIIIPARGQDPEALVAMIQEANRSVVEESEVLSDDLYICESGHFRRISYGGVIPLSEGIPS